VHKYKESERVRECTHANEREKHTCTQTVRVTATGTPTERGREWERHTHTQIHTHAWAKSWAEEEKWERLLISLRNWSGCLASRMLCNTVHTCRCDSTSNSDRARVYIRLYACILRCEYSMMKKSMYCNVHFLIYVHTIRCNRPTQSIIYFAFR